MSASAVVFEPDEELNRRTLMIGNRLFLAANTMLMGAMIFAYLFLRGNNYGGNWRPDGIADLPSVSMAVTLLLQLACLVAVLGALRAVQGGADVRALGAVALVFGLAAGVARVWYQYNLGSGWVITNGTYTAVSEMWFAILIVELLLGWFWLLSIVVAGPRNSTKAATTRHLRAFSEFWFYMLIASTFVWLLVRLV
jgi:heme/copper-type cytochrome/quinol oxidase subunit 3